MNTNAGWDFGNAEIEDMAATLASAHSERQLRLLALQVERAIQISVARSKTNVPRSGWHRSGTPADSWSFGTNIPGYLPDTTEVAVPRSWEDAMLALKMELDHERGLIEDDPDGNPEDAEFLRDEIDRLDAVPSGSDVEIAANDSTGQVRVFFVMKAE